MSNISIIGAGNMGSAIAGIAAKGGANVQLLARDAEKSAAAAKTVGASPATFGDELTGELVFLAVPWPAVDDVIATYGDQLSGKVVVDLTNPVDFATFDGLAVPADSSKAAQIAQALPGAKVLKAFNTNLSASLVSGNVGGVLTTVLVAGDDAQAKAAVIELVRAGGVQAEDAGSLKRARELESLGFLQITLAASETISWTGGFALVK